MQYKYLANFIKLPLVFRIISFTTLLISLFGCIEEDNFAAKLPPITATGENTIGCLLNGEVYVPRTNRFGTLPITLSFPEPPEYWLTIQTYRTSIKSTIKDISLRISTIGIKKNGSYQVSISGKFENAHYDNNSEHCDGNKNCVNLTGILEIIKYDSVNKIISGTFNANLIQTNIPHELSLSVTEGRFDLKQLNYE